MLHSTYLGGGEHLCFFSSKFISYVASYVGPIQTGPKKLRQNRNRDSCEKSATVTENTGIRRIPAGITNLAGGAGRLSATTTTTDGDRGLDAIVGGAQDAAANGERNDRWRIR